MQAKTEKMPFAGNWTHIGAKNNDRREDAAFDKFSQIAMLGAEAKALSAVVTNNALNEAEGTRTCDLQIRKMLCWFVSTYFTVVYKVKNHPIDSYSRGNSNCR